MRLYSKFKKATLVAACALLFSACNDLEEVNINPNDPESVPVGTLMTASQVGMMTYMWDQWNNGRGGLLYSQYWSQNDYTDESRYKLRPGTNNSYWTLFYSGSAAGFGGLMELQRVIELNQNPTYTATFSAAAKENIPNQIAMARILKVWMYQILTDMYGDIPYSQALTGSVFRSPAYDKQSDIYKNLLKELTEASAQINTAAPAQKMGDVIFGGDMTKWKRFANSLKLRVAIRMADADAATAKTAVAEAIAAGVMTANSDDALLRFGSEPNNNPLHEDRKTRADFAVSNVLIEKLQQLGDPRLMEFAAPAAKTGLYVGEVYGLNTTKAPATKIEDVSQPNLKVISATSPGIYMTYSETCFALAEAVARGFIAGDAADYYSKGIKASMSFWGVDAAKADDYVAANPYDAAKWKTSIGVQKWIALYMQGHQGWFEWRRLDFGVLRMPADGSAVTGLSTIPTRVTYPSDEQTLNGANYTKAVSSIGADKLDTRVWWDVAPNTVLPAVLPQ